MDTPEFIAILISMLGIIVSYFAHNKAKEIDARMLRDKYLEGVWFHYEADINKCLNVQNELLSNIDRSFKDVDELRVLVARRNYQLPKIEDEKWDYESDFQSALKSYFGEYEQFLFRLFELGEFLCPITYNRAWFDSNRHKFQKEIADGILDGSSRPQTGSSEEIFIRRMISNYTKLHREYVSDSERIDFDVFDPNSIESSTEYQQEYFKKKKSTLEEANKLLKLNESLIKKSIRFNYLYRRKTQ